MITIKFRRWRKYIEIIFIAILIATYLLDTELYYFPEGLVLLVFRFLSFIVLTGSIIKRLEELFSPRSEHTKEIEKLTNGFIVFLLITILCGVICNSNLLVFSRDQIFFNSHHDEFHELEVLAENSACTPPNYCGEWITLPQEIQEWAGKSRALVSSNPDGRFIILHRRTGYNFVYVSNDEIQIENRVIGVDSYNVECWRRFNSNWYICTVSL